MSSEVERLVESQWQRYKRETDMLVKKAPPKPGIKLKTYYDVAATYLSRAEAGRATDNLRQAYIYYKRFLYMLVHTIMKHPDFRSYAYAEDRQWCELHVKEDMDILEHEVIAEMKEEIRADIERKREEAIEKNLAQDEAAAAAAMREAQKLAAMLPPAPGQTKPNVAAVAEAIETLNVSEEAYAVTLPDPSKSRLGGYPVKLPSSSSEGSEGAFYPVLEPGVGSQALDAPTVRSVAKTIATAPIEPSPSLPPPEYPGPPPPYTPPPSKETPARGGKVENDNKIEPYPTGAFAMYTDSSGKKTRARIIKAHAGGEKCAVPYYTIKLMGGREKQTVHSRLSDIIVSKAAKPIPGQQRPPQKVQPILKPPQPQPQLNQPTRLPPPQPQLNQPTHLPPPHRQLQPQPRQKRGPQPARPPLIFVEPAKILRDPRGWSVFPEYKTPPVRRISHSPDPRRVMKYTSSLRVPSVGSFSEVPSEDFCQGMRKILQRYCSRHGKDGYYYYAMPPPFTNIFVDLKLARELVKYFKVQELSRQVVHEQGFFANILQRGVVVPSGQRPLNGAEVKTLQNLLHENGAATVIARITCPLRAHKKPDEVVLNLETQNLSTLVHERWLDNFALDFLFAMDNEKYLHRGHVFLPTILQSLMEIQSDKDVQELVICTIQSLCIAQKCQPQNVVLRNLYVPWLRSQSHWCLGIISMERRRLESFDSLQLSPLGSLTQCMTYFAATLSRYLQHLPQIRGAVVDRSSEWNRGKPQGYVNGRHVITSGSCGSCAVRAAESIAEKNSLRWGYEDMPYWRLHQMSSFLSHCKK
eukprot:g2005.t1